MAILHGVWLNKKQNSCLFIWGETWRSAQVNADISDSEIPSHPLAMTAQELSEWLNSHNLKIANFIQQPQVAVTAGRKRQSTAVKEVALPSQSQIIALPTQISANSISPIHSAVESIDSQPYLHPWKIEGFCLQPSVAIKFLASLPLSNISGKDAFLSGDLRFWSQVARWSLDLIARGKFLPTIQREPEKLITSWQVLLDSALDGTRLEKFSQLMPLGCLTYQTAIEAEEFTPSQLYVDLPLSPQELILGFLHSTIDVQVREMLGSQALIEPRMMAALPAGVRQWLQGLTTESPTINADAIGVERLQAALTAWTLPLQYQLTHKALFRTCFELRSPQVGESAWKLIYYLQAADDPGFLVDAATIWQHPVEQLVYQNRTIEQPQETFMRGLGLASRLYPAIAPSLETEFPESLSLNPIQAYDFIKSVAWRLEDSGLGVVLPASLANREGWANRLGLKITAETPNQQQGRLGLQSLLNFQWKLAIGGQTISKAQFDRLVALNSPLVEINSEWVELRPQDIKTAQSFFASRKEKMSLSLEDALRLSTGDTQAIEKLPVVSFEASGALQELIGALTNNQAIAPLPTPANFKGELRPYQQRGAAWLAFLERWGLGACLADDMGLGKCVAPDTLVNINGTLCTAEEIWTNYASKTEFDGEGFWTIPTEKLLVNSLDTQTGKIVKAEVKHLYRQQVSETLRKITLQNGNSITITRRHQLLTHQGWTNNLKVGDSVCVPARTLCNTQKSTITLAPLCENLSAPLRLKIFKPPTSITQTLEADSPIDLTQQSWQKLSHQQVLYSRIETIEDINYQGWVYDLEVRKYHNFVANDIICHNTIQFIAFLLHLKEQDVLEKPTLLVCPTSVLGNWEREVKKFAPTLKILQYHGDKRPKGKTFTETAKKYNIVVTSYSLIHRDLKSLQTVDWQAIVLDEAQNVKNSDAKQSQAVRQLEATFRIALTGTPVENRLQELWSILDFLNPGYLGNKQFFQRRFAMPIEKYGDSASLNQLRSLVQPFILRRLKTDKDIIQDLPEKQEMTVFCGLSPEQATLYQKVVEESLSEIDTATGLQRRGMILALLIKLKQVCNHPAQYLKADSLDKYNSGKLQRLDEMLEEAIAEGDRALIFTQFAEWGKLLKPHLEKQLGREIFFLYGSTSKKQREEMIDRFQQDPQGPPIMILSLKAGGVGLNLTRANHVFHFDRWWNPAVENQATDRVFRIGQTRNVQVHKFVCTGTLEEKIHDMIESKKQLAEQVVGAGEDWLTELDTDQLRNLLLLDRSSVIEEDAE